MPRNNTGIYALPVAPFVPGTVISSAAVNSDFADIASALTGSVAANGVTQITGQLKSSFTTGPAYTSSADSNTGFGSSAMGRADIWAGNIIIASVTSVGLAVIGAISATGNATIGGNLIVTGSVTAGSFAFTGTGAIQIPSGTTAQRPTPAQGQVRYNTDLGHFEGYDGVEWDPMSQLNTAYKITASAASNLLTVNVLNGQTNAVPTVADPVSFEFQNGIGGTVFATASAALTINTNGVGATLGSSNGVPFRFWLIVFYNAGTPVLGLVNCSNGSTIIPLTENVTQNGTSISAAATTFGVIYTPNGTTVSTSVFKILGYVEYSAGLATAGTYGSSPTGVIHFTVGTKTPGAIVQTVSAGSSTLAIQPISSINLIKFYGFINGNAAANATPVTITFRRGSTGLITQLLGGSGATAMDSTASAQFIDGPQTSSPVSYNIAVSGATFGAPSAYIMLDENNGLKQMPFNPVTRIYTPAAGAESAVPGEVIASATWNAIFTDISNALTQLGQGTVTLPQRSVIASAQLPIVSSDVILNINNAGDLTPIIPLASSRAGVPLILNCVVGSHLQTLTRTSPDTFNGNTTIILNPGATITLVPYNDGVNSGYSLQ